MKFSVVILRRAESDLRRIWRYIYQFSPVGANSWILAYQQAIELLETTADSFEWAYENQQFDIGLKQLVFKTSKGRAYRLIYTIDGNEVRILRIRGPGQAPLNSPDLQN